ncbi:hypothetical protein BDZ97DRAFT_2059402 [Flammula alnicola]|nr:hypothetical protein BDZ97DRAFT_2059402 [Flammula alnicola]
MVELPTELWFRIAQFVPDLDLFPLATVNRLFLDLVIDRRYRQLIIDDDQPGVLIQKLARIEQDPLVADRVRSLTVHPKAVRSACLKSAKGTKRRVRPLRNQHWPDAFRLRSERFPLEEDTELADKFLASLGYLHAIEEYAIEWQQGVEPERSFCLPLLSAIWPPLGQNLRVVKLDMMLSHLCDMVSPVTGLDRVQELSLHFTCNDGRFGPWGGPGYSAKQAFEQLAGFMNRLALSLQSLTLSSIGHLNFSWLYASLSYFPHLNYLALFVPCDPRHIVDPTGFHNFLSAHKDIAHFSFSPQYCCHQSSLGPEPQHGCASAEDWLNRAFGAITFQNLHSLELGLNILGSGGKRVMLPVPRVGSAARDVRSLVVLGCIISLDDLHVLLRPFSQAAATPRSFTLEVHVLDVTLLDLLANCLPGLETLDLTYRWIGTSGSTNVNKFTKNLRDKEYAAGRPCIGLFSDVLVKMMILVGLPNKPLPVVYPDCGSSVLPIHFVCTRLTFRIISSSEAGTFLVFSSDDFLL